jgi:hypothetical protein
MRLILAGTLALVTLTAALPAAAQSPSSTEITFTKHVAPILQKNCQVCHRPDTFAPMSLLTYDEVRPWARSMKAKVVAREMPPFYIDRNVGIQKFSNDVSLTDAEIDLIARWVDAGAPQGNPADMPPPRVFADEKQWQFGKYGQPDLVVPLPQDYMMPTTGPDHWPSILVDLGLTEDRYLAGVQIIPTKGYRLIHHIRSSLVPPAVATSAREAEEGGEAMGRFLNEYAIGKGADVFPEDSGRLVKAGTKVNVSFHLHPNYGEVSEDVTPVNIALGLKFHPKGYKPKHIVISDSGKYPGVDIRPGDPNARVDGYYLLKKPTRLLSWQPHMHNRGKASCILAIIPAPEGIGGDGLTSAQPGFETLNCAKFTFNWHLNYVYADDAAPLLPAGTMLHTINLFDNSAANKMNNDPTAQVSRGNRTIDEMSGGWLGFYQMSEEEYKAELAQRADGARGYSVPSARAPR